MTGDASKPGVRVNPLGNESSPYLLLHRHNPVDWYPWASEALDRARREDKPIFLSVGYSTCYWCHVMERESFSDPDVAALMNREFINIKVDREERPDLDEIYMLATQFLAEQGGWPNSVFLTPDLAPFFAGTYFPPQDRPGLPGFTTVLNSMAAAWRERREEVVQQAGGVVAAIRDYAARLSEPAASAPDSRLAEAGLDDLRRRFDPTAGGFGSAPKFPTPSNLLLLLEFAGESVDATRMLDETLDQMARGGIFDQLDGGFHRYATDREWRIPHFEKMLYDNGLLLEVYARRWEVHKDPEFERIARETAGFLGRRLSDPGGGFWSAIDAETEGREGAYYVWTRSELAQVLSDEDFGFAAPLLGFATPPFFEGESYVLHRPDSLVEQAARRRLTSSELLRQLQPVRDRLLAARDRRSRPATDDKILTDWNGMAIGGLALAGRVFGEGEWIGRAVRAAEFVCGTLRPGGRLHHSWRQGRLGRSVFLADYAFLNHGLIELARATSEPRWLEAALDLQHEQRERLGSADGGFYTAEAVDDLIVRTREVMDGAVPAAYAVSVLNMIDLGQLTGDTAWLDQASRGLMASGGIAARHPAAVKTLAIAALRLSQRDEMSKRGGCEGVVPGTAGSLGEGDGKRGGMPREPVQIQWELEPADDTGFRGFRLVLEIAPGWYVGGAGSSPDGVSPLRVSTREAALEDLTYAVPDGTAQPSEASPTLQAEVVIHGRVRSFDPRRAALLVHLQACREGYCVPPVELVIPIESDSSQPSS